MRANRSGRDDVSNDLGLVDEGLELLTEEQCFALVTSGSVGRVAVSIGALPAVFPVNYCLVDRDVVFRTAEGTKLTAALEHAVVAFEVDDFDPEDHRGWSVLIVGQASEIPAAELAGLEPLPVRAWAHGARDRVVRITGELVSGRRIVFDHEP